MGTPGTRTRDPAEPLRRIDIDWLGLLRRAGVEPSDVDTVLLTHLHVDHVGFATHLAGGRWVPTFAGSPHLTTVVEYGFWTSAEAKPHLERLGDYLSDSVAPLQEAGLLTLVAPDHQVSDEVRLRPAPGHTPGNVCVEVRSEGRLGLFTGDMIHHPLQLAFPDWSTDFCIDRGAAGHAREALLREIADTDALLFTAHFPGSLPGRVMSDGDGYRYVPEPGVAV